MRFVTDEVGNKVRSTEYDPFGNWRAAVGQANIHMLYQGQQQDPESSLYYLRARYYDPLIGRFISKDPVKGSLTLPQSQNPYAYALNNPINLSDPSGEAAVGLCVSVDVGLGVYGTCSLCLQLTSDRQIGITFTAGGGGTTGVTLGGGGQVQVTNANNLKQISGQDVFAGGSARFIPGRRLDLNKDSDDPSIWGASVNLGPGASANFSPPFPGGEFHGGSIYTWALPLLNF